MATLLRLLWPSNSVSEELIMSARKEEKEREHDLFARWSAIRETSSDCAISMPSSPIREQPSGLESIALMIDRAFQGRGGR